MTINQHQPATERLFSKLRDIAANVRFQSDFCVNHPDYKPFEMPKEMIVRLQAMPQEVRARYQGLLLRSFLYGIYYNGSMHASLALDADSDTALTDLENNTFLGVDLNFFHRLHDHNTGNGYFNGGWSVVACESDGSLVVTKGGLQLHVDRDHHLPPEQRTAAVGDSVAIRMPKNLLQNGFYVAVGDAGSEPAAGSKPNPVTVRVYFNLMPAGAVAVMKDLTQALNEVMIPFKFKVLYNPDDYQRYDSGVLYFDRDDYAAIQPILAAVYSAQYQHFQPDTPLFTKPLAPGLGLAEEPDRTFSERESFGLNRCQIVANGLLEAQQKGRGSSDEPLACILRHFAGFGVDWQRPYLNTTSEDVYGPVV